MSSEAGEVPRPPSTGHVEHQPALLGRLVGADRQEGGGPRGVPEPCPGPGCRGWGGVAGPGLPSLLSGPP